MGPSVAMTAPAKNGPRTRERLNWAELSATALATSSSGTDEGTRALIDGPDSASVIPTTSERAMIIQTWR
jgi:hypothetical protein